MNLILKRYKTGYLGVLSDLLDENDVKVATCLEHAYLQSNGLDYAAKIRPGTYDCVRGMHRLYSMRHEFETFEITHVPGHYDLLFHWGNYNRDSDGCVLLGESEENWAVTKSRTTFDKFMTLQSGVNIFTLKVL